MLVKTLIGISLILASSTSELKSEEEYRYDGSEIYIVDFVKEAKNELKRGQEITIIFKNEKIVFKKDKIGLVIGEKVKN